MDQQILDWNYVCHYGSDQVTIVVYGRSEGEPVQRVPAA